ncbi:MAG: HAD family hydrolase [Theionarchaea archaeon]|nr:HAD family hydrolase [Theionarchaea archaeon]
MIKILSFDLCGTLVDCSFADYVWKEGVPHLYAEKQGIPFEDAKRRVTAEYDKVGGDDIRYFELEYWFRYLNLDGTPHDLVHAYKEMIAVYEEVPEVLERLSKKYTLIVASLAHRDLLPLALSDIQSYFDHVFSATSDFSYVRKHQKFYSDILGLLSVNPSDVVHVGDDYIYDCEVPRDVGIHAFFLERTGTGELRNLREVESKIRELEKMKN